MAKGQNIFISGESRLIEEYAAMCALKKIPVAVRANPGEKPKLSKGVAKASRPSKSITLALELTNTSANAKKENLIFLDAALASSIPIISSSVTVTVAEQSSWIKNPQRLIGIGAMPSLLEGGLLEFATSPVTNDRTVVQAKVFSSAIGKDIAFVQDSIGLVMPRILCMLTNEAYFAMAEGVAAGGDIDTAMKLGTNYPSGPVERAGKIGLKQIHAVLSALHRYFGEDRYRVAPLLQQAVFMGA